MPETDESSIVESKPREFTELAGTRPDSLPFPISGMFIGPDGLRAIWGILLFLILIFGLPICLSPLVKEVEQGMPDRSGPMSPQLVLTFEGVGVFCVLLATFVLALVERRPVSAYGLRPQRRAVNFLAGLLTGVLLLSLLVICLHAMGLLVFDTRLLFGRSILRYGAIWFGGFLLVGLREELVNRGYLQFTLTRGLKSIYAKLCSESRAEALAFWTAAFILSIVFGYSHRTNPGESPLGLLAAVLAGFLLCLSLWRTGSLWWAIGFHASWDWAQSFLYGVPDSGLIVQGRLFATHSVGQPFLSGGLTGPEGSILLLPVMAVGVTMIFFTLPHAHHAYLPAREPQPSVH